MADYSTRQVSLQLTSLHCSIVIPIFSRHIFAMYGQEEKEEEDSSKPIMSGPYAEAALKEQLNKDEMRYYGPQVNGSMMFLCPLISLIVEKLYDDEKQKAETGNQFNTSYATNGAVILNVQLFILYNLIIFIDLSCCWSSVPHAQKLNK